MHGIRAERLAGSAGGGVDVRQAHYQDTKERVHRALLNRLNLDRLTRVGRERGRAGDPQPDHDAARNRDGEVPLSLFEREALITDVLNELFGLGPLEALLDGPDGLRHPGQPLRPGLRRARRQARAEPARVQGRPAPAAHHRAHRELGRAAASTSRARWSTRGSPTARVSTPSFRRWRSTARCCRSAGSAPTGSARATSSTAQSLTQPMLEFLRAAVGGAPQHHRLGRHRRRQDDVPQRRSRASSRNASASSPSKTPPS